MSRQGNIVIEPPKNSSGARSSVVQAWRCAWLFDAGQRDAVGPFRLGVSNPSLARGSPTAVIRSADLPPVAGLHLVVTGTTPSALNAGGLHGRSAIAGRRGIAIGVAICCRSCGRGEAQRTWTTYEI